MTDKQKYRAFCKTENEIPIFSKDWWLDVVCGEVNWDVVLIEKGGEVVASMPYFRIKRLIFTLIAMPKLTQNMGVYIKYPKGQKYYKKLSWEKEIMTDLAEKLPDVDRFSQTFHYRVTNWLPFYWQGYEQTTRYTYVIDENTSMEALDSSLETDIRRRRRKADQSGIRVIEKNDPHKFYTLNKMTFERRGKDIPYSFETVEKIYHACQKNGLCKIFFAETKDHRDIAAAFLIADENSVYYLMGGIDPKYKNLGGMDLILHESIRFALENNKSFDFEGSMVQSIEKYFRSFGAVQKPYFQITKTNSKLLKALTLVKELLK
ncbi:GNAT family N-acetyltransferase [Thiomicrolovo sp. ZZH C-3]